MAIPTTRQEFRDYILRDNGEPVIKVVASPEQIDDCVDAATNFTQKCSKTGAEQVYFAHKLTQDDLNKHYVQLPPGIVSVTQALALNGGGFGTMGIGGAVIPGFGFVGGTDSAWSLASSGAQPGGIGYSVQIRNFLAEVQFNSEYRSRPCRWNLNTNRVHIDASDSQFAVGNFIMLDAQAIVDPYEFSRMWNDEFMKRYGSAKLKFIFGKNTSKFTGQILGGLSYDGKAMRDEAIAELKELEDDVLSSMRYGAGVGMRIG